MAELGVIALMLGLVLSLYGAVASVAGRVYQIPELAVSGRRAMYMTLVSSFAAGGALIAAFVNHDYSIKYVFDHSNNAMDTALTWVAFYAGNEGSLLYILMVLAAITVIAIGVTPARFNRSMPFTIGILATVQAFYFFVLVFFASPFEPLGSTVTDGRGINPLLTHPGMFSHPPLLMAGLVGITLPFAYAAGALISGNYGDDWVDVARVSGIIVWGILGTGLLLGAWWAYTILGWGGYWGWDPIENVAFMPWLAMTAFLHSIMVQKRRGMFRMWNVALLNIAFVLAQLGMFINRGGPVVSVHSFASSTLGMVFLSFMLLALAFAFGVFLWRYPQLKSDRAIESFMSREASFLINNFLLLSVVAIVLWGVVYPVFSDLARNVSVSVSAPYFNRTAGPMLLAVIVVMGIGPLLPWRRTSRRSIRQWFIWPAAAAALTIAGLLLTGIHTLVAVVAFGAVAFVASSICEEWWRGSAARHRAGDPWHVAWWRLVNGNRPRHGGYVVHLAILALAVGIIGTQFFDQRTDLALAQGQSAILDNYRIEYVSSESEERADRLAQWANMNVYRIDPAEYDAERAQARIAGKNGFVVDGPARGGDRLIGTLEPWHGFYSNFNQVSVRSGIRSTPLEDLYVIPRDFLSDGRVSLAVSINPLAMWLWISGPIFLLGTAIALWPQPAVERGRVTLPSPERRAAAPSGAQEVSK